MRESGVKSFKTPNVMKQFAENCLRKGDIKKAMDYISRALKIADEVLDGVKVHKKYIGLMRCKVEILIKNKQYKEAIVESDSMMKMIEQLMGGKENAFYKMYLNWKGNVYVEYKEENYKAEDYFKETLRWVEQFY